MNALNWIGQETTTALSLTLLHSLWQVSLAVGILWCVERIWRQLPVDRNYTLHAGVLVLTLALLPMTFYWVQPTRETYVATPISPEPSAQLAPPPSVAIASEFAIPAAAQGPAEPSPEVIPSVAIPSERDAAAPASNWWPVMAMWVAACYVLGVLVMLSRLMLGIRRTERIRRCATRIEPGPLAGTFARLARELGVSLGCVLATSRDVLVPTVVGVVKPTILLPASALTGLSASELEMILLHELAHVRRHDQWVNLIQRLAEVVLFFNPALWYLSRRIATLREYCCDELTCRQMTPGDSAPHVEYAATLLHVVELARPASPVPAELTALAATGRGPSELRRRVARLFGEPLAEPMRLSRGGFMVVMSLAATIFLAMAPSISAIQTPDQGKSTTAKDGVATIEVAAGAQYDADTQRQPHSLVPIQCLDADQNPVAGAEVYVFQHEGGDNGKYRQFGPFTTNVDGKALWTVAISNPTTEDQRYDRFYYARVPGKLVGLSQTAIWPGRVAVNPEDGVVVFLLPSRSVHGRVNVPDGFDPTGVTISVNSIATTPESRKPVFPRKVRLAGGDSALASIFATQVTSDGTFHLEDVFRDASLSLSGTAKGLGESQWYSYEANLDDIELNFAKEGILKGTVTTPDGKPMANAEVSAQIQASVGQRVGYLTTFRTTTDDQGRYELRGLPEWDLAISVTDLEDNLVFRPTAPFLIAAGTETTRDLAMEPPEEGTGRVVDPDGNPFEGAEVKTTLNRLREELAKDKPNDTTSSSATPAETVPIQCLDADEKPVAGAEVYVFQHEGGDNGKYRQFGPFTTDADGKAMCDEWLGDAEKGHYMRFLYARVPGKLVGVARSLNLKDWRTNSEGRIEMRPSRSVSGQITVPDGFDPTKVNVRVANLTVRTGPEIEDFHSFPRKQDFAGLNTALPEIFERTPDVEGRFEFADVPIDGVLYLVTDADGLGEGQFYTSQDDASKPMEILLAKEGRLMGIVTGENGEPLPGIEVAAQIHPIAGQHVGHLSTFRTKSDDEGKYELVGLPEWDLVLRVSDPEKKFAFCPSAPFFVASGTEMTRDLTMEQPIEVRGRVVDPDGNPVEAAWVSTVMADSARTGVTAAVSDSEGNFVLRMPVGKFEIYFSGLPKGFKNPDLSNCPKLTIARDQSPIEDLELVAPRGDANDRAKGGATATLQTTQSNSQPLLDVMAQVHGYKPGEGRVLARVAPPFDVIRLEYYRAANPSQAGEIDEGPTAMTFRWDGENLSSWGSSFGDRDDPGYTITGLLDVLLEQKPQSISGPKSLLDKPLAGDWVMRTGADRQQVVAELEKILRNEFGMKVRLRIRNLERDVYVATGRYQFKPIDDSSLETNTAAGNGSLNRIQVFANKLTPEAGAGGGSGEVDRFLLMLGRWIDTPIVSELGPASQRYISWRFHERTPSTTESRREDHDPELVLANITRQTGIEFKKDRRTVEVLFVEEEE